MKLTISIKGGLLPSASVTSFPFMSQNTIEQQIRAMLNLLTRFFTVDKINDGGYYDRAKIYILICRIHMDQTDLKEKIINQFNQDNKSITLISLDKEQPIFSKEIAGLKKK